MVSKYMTHEYVLLAACTNTEPLSELAQGVDKTDQQSPSGIPCCVCENGVSLSRAVHLYRACLVLTLLWAVCVLQ